MRDLFSATELLEHFGKEGLRALVLGEPRLRFDFAGCRPPARRRPFRRPVSQVQFLLLNCRGQLLHQSFEGLPRSHREASQQPTNSSSEGHLTATLSSSVVNLASPARKARANTQVITLSALRPYAIVYGSHPARRACHSTCV